MAWSTFRLVLQSVTWAPAATLVHGPVFFSKGLLLSPRKPTLATLNPQGYVHRDIKPENFLIGRGDRRNAPRIHHQGIHLRFYED